MTKPPKNVRLEDMNKTTLVKTVKTLRTRETKLLNRIAKLEGELIALKICEPARDALPAELTSHPVGAFPWEKTS